MRNPGGPVGARALPIFWENFIPLHLGPLSNYCVAHALSSSGIVTSIESKMVAYRWLSRFQIPGIAIIISLSSNPGVLILLRFHHKVVKGCPEINFGGKRVENEEKGFFGQKRSFASGSQPKSWESWKKLYLRNRRSDFNKVFSVFPVFSNAKISASCHQDSTTFALEWFSKFILMTAQHNNGINACMLLNIHWVHWTLILNIKWLVKETMIFVA